MGCAMVRSYILRLDLYRSFFVFEEYREVGQIYACIRRTQNEQQFESTDRIKCGRNGFCFSCGTRMHVPVCRGERDRGEFIRKQLWESDAYVCVCM